MGRRRRLQQEQGGVTGASLFVHICWREHNACSNSFFVALTLTITTVI